jgi:hypothetical protein
MPASQRLHHPHNARRWVLQPSVARTSSLCLTTICDSWRYLAACSAKRELSAHEDALLGRCRRDVEELLRVP